VLYPLTTEGIPTDDPYQCWLWVGHRNSHNRRKYRNGRVLQIVGRGIFWVGNLISKTGSRGRWVKAHRFAYEAAWGPVPEGLDVCHSCDEPLCVNYNHLYAAPHSDNMDDYIRKFGAVCVPKTRLSTDQLIALRATGIEPRTNETDSLPCVK
jgi:hypothetical protein